MNAFLIGLIVLLATALIAAVVGAIFAPKPMRAPDPFYDDLEELCAEAAMDGAPYLATCGSNEDLKNCSLPDAPSGKPPLAAGRMYAGRQHFGCFRGAL
jgi:hypothetical protein